MKNNLAPRSSPQLPEAIVAGIALWLLVIPVLTAQEESFEKVGEPYTMQAKPSQPGQSVGEVMLDEGGIEILWRVHYRFFEPVKAGQDTDRDGIDDVAEATAWTLPTRSRRPLVLPMGDAKARLMLAKCSPSRLTENLPHLRIYLTWMRRAADPSQ